MTTLSAKDVRERPGEFFIVARSARGHAHIPVDDFDTLLEGIGASAGASQSFPDGVLKLMQDVATEMARLRAEHADMRAQIERHRSAINAIREHGSFVSGLEVEEAV